MLSHNFSLEFDHIRKEGEKSTIHLYYSKAKWVVLNLIGRGKRIASYAKEEFHSPQMTKKRMHWKNFANQMRVSHSLALSTDLSVEHYLDDRYPFDAERGCRVDVEDQGRGNGTTMSHTLIGVATKSVGMDVTATST